MNGLILHWLVVIETDPYTGNGGALAEWQIRLST